MFLKLLNEDLCERPYYPSRIVRCVGSASWILRRQYAFHESSVGLHVSRVVYGSDCTHELVQSARNEIVV
jgi:hypothetical protein